MKSNNKTDNKDKLKPLFLIFIIVIILWFVSHLMLVTIYDNWTDRAALGDSFGAINSLFSGLAFGGLIYTILLQRKELELQREEIKEMAILVRFVPPISEWFVPLISVQTVPPGS
ncbi:hypothetical protein GM418_30595 [Maribellus comscasis]|uniref:Uncharacterized protein n=1 Tax=Maribellus comscasis TaxID=2681766 RepID=A0A6I6K2E9_9BACT|nr:hypothetical protein [Maribellus comscasis]QGY47849.1 hypothetical protein GM418_30595 [Maribellus comscasis]